MAKAEENPGPNKFRYFNRYNVNIKKKCNFATDYFRS